MSDNEGSRYTEGVAKTSVVTCLLANCCFSDLAQHLGLVQTVVSVI